MLFISAVSGIGSAAQDDWIQVQSPHFIVITNARRGEAWDVTDEFERIHAVYQRAITRKPDRPPPPTVIFAVTDNQSFRELLPDAHEELAGRFLESKDGPRIVLRLNVPAEVGHATLYHEYHHAMLRASYGRGTPSWLREGLAEFWSQATITLKDVEIGTAHDAHLQYLRRQTTFELAPLFAPNGSTHDMDPRDRRAFYASAWVLTHWILMADRGDGEEKLNRYIESIMEGGDPNETFESTFGPVTKVESEVRRYFRQSTFSSKRFPAPAEINEAFSIRELSAEESVALRSRFLTSRGRTASTRGLRERTGTLGVGAEAEGVEAFESYELELARERFEEAVSAGAATHLSHYYLALLSQQEGDRANVASRLEHTLDLDPEFAPAIIALAEHYAREPERSERALELARRALALTPDDRFELVRLGRTFVALELLDAAQDVLARLKAMPSAPGSAAMIRALEDEIARQR